MRSRIRDRIAIQRQVGLITTDVEASVRDALGGKTYTVAQVAEILKKSKKFVQRRYHADPRVFHVPGSGSRESLLIPRRVIEADLEAMLRNIKKFD